MITPAAVWRVGGEPLVDGSGGAFSTLEAEAARQVGLGVEVDEEHLLVGEREGCR